MADQLKIGKYDQPRACGRITWRPIRYGEHKAIEECNGQEFRCIHAGETSEWFKYSHQAHRWFLERVRA